MGFQNALKWSAKLCVCVFLHEEGRQFALRSQGALGVYDAQRLGIKCPKV